MIVRLKSYVWFLFLAIWFAVFAFCSDTESTFDINIHDTYFVIAHLHLYMLFAVVFFTLFTFYWSFDKSKTKLITLFSKIHIYGTVISTGGLIFPYQLIFDSSDFPLYDDLQYINLCLIVSGLLFFSLQFLFIINIFVTIIKNLINGVTG